MNPEIAGVRKMYGATSVTLCEHDAFGHFTAVHPLRNTVGVVTNLDALTCTFGARQGLLFGAVADTCAHTTTLPKLGAARRVRTSAL